MEASSEKQQQLWEKNAKKISEHLYGLLGRFIKHYANLNNKVFTDIGLNNVFKHIEVEGAGEDWQIIPSKNEEQRKKINDLMKNHLSHHKEHPYFSQAKLKKMTPEEEYTWNSIKIIGTRIIELLKRINKMSETKSIKLKDIQDWFASSEGLGLTLLIYATELEQKSIKSLPVYSNDQQGSDLLTLNSTTTMNQAGISEDPGLEAKTIIQSLEFDCRGRASMIAPNYMKIEIGEIKTNDKQMKQCRRQLKIRLNTLEKAAKYIHGKELQVQKVGWGFYFTGDSPSKPPEHVEDQNITYNYMSF
ncbi:unnamed protein product [Adineta steineri]|uniref:Uncharacterized protein n=1 Tax=Adineta steineri TaxID=433720 RepID=A0A818WUA3_9BILA|nr:unnamed protein product [Adineta steineri]CAF3730965.1 unnamed protein product [Adineta steineri]